MKKNNGKVIKIFEKDEMSLREVQVDWSIDELLAQQGVFFLKDMIHLLRIDSSMIKKRARSLIAKGRTPWKVMGARKIWNHWIVRMKVFAPSYRKHLKPKYRPVPPRYDANQVLQIDGIFLLSEVCGKIPFSAHQLRYQARLNPQPRTECGIWKDQDLGVFLVEMETFAPWIKRIWGGDFTRQAPSKNREPALVEA